MRRCRARAPPGLGRARVVDDAVAQLGPDGAALLEQVEVPEHLGEHQVRLRHRHVAPEVAADVGGRARMCERGIKLRGVGL